MNNTERLESTFDIVIGQLGWQVTHKDGTDMLIGGSDWYWDNAIQERGSLKEFIPVL